MRTITSDRLYFTSLRWTILPHDSESVEARRRAGLAYVKRSLLPKTRVFMRGMEVGKVRGPGVVNGGIGQLAQAAIGDA